MSFRPEVPSRYGSRNTRSVDNRSSSLRTAGFLLCEFLRLAGCRCAPVEHASNFVPEGANAPPLDAAYFGVEVALYRVLQGQESQNVTPAQLSRQRYDNLPVRVKFGKLDHAPEALLGEASARIH